MQSMEGRSSTGNSQSSNFRRGMHTGCRSSSGSHEKQEMRTQKNKKLLLSFSCFPTNFWFDAHHVCRVRPSTDNLFSDIYRIKLINFKRKNASRTEVKICLTIITNELIHKFGLNHWKEHFGIASQGKRYERERERGSLLHICNNILTTSRKIGHGGKVQKLLKCATSQTKITNKLHRNYN